MDDRLLAFERLLKIMDELREKFKGYIRNIETIVIRKQHFKGVPYMAIT